MDLKLHDIVELKKDHPCGSRRWEVLRVGMDIRLRCTGCGHEVLAPGARWKKHQACDSKGGNPMKKQNWTRYVAMGVALLMAIVMILGLILPYVGL